jgi:T-complex protein 1 subunit delta
MSTLFRSSNIQAAKALSDAIRTSLGPKGMDKMIQVRFNLLLLLRSAAFTEWIGL